jgi:hypothetical protein
MSTSRRTGPEGSSAQASRGCERPGTPSFSGKMPACFPRRLHPCLQSSIPPRIHCKALQRGGVGACGAGRTCAFITRACGKWSPSGDTGEAAGCRTSPFASCPGRRAGCACAAHKGAGSGGCVGIVRRDDRSPEGEPFRPVRHGVRPDDKNGQAHPGNRRRTPPAPALAEGPKSRAQTAERGAERCHPKHTLMRQLPAPRPKAL